MSEQVKPIAGRYLTVKQVAEMLHCCTRTVRRRMEDGELKGKRAGGYIIFRLEDVEAYVDSLPDAETD